LLCYRVRYIKYFGTDAFLNSVTLSSGTTSNLYVNDEVVFANSVGGLIAGNKYYIKSINSSTGFSVSANINGVAVALSTVTYITTGVHYPRTTTLTIAASNVSGSLLNGYYIKDSAGVRPNNSYISNITGTTTLTLYVSWNANLTVAGTSGISFVTADTRLTIMHFSLIVE